MVDFVADGRETSLVGRPDFKSGKGPPAGPWWVRLPLSSAGSHFLPDVASTAQIVRWVNAAGVRAAKNADGIAPHFPHGRASRNALIISNLSRPCLVRKDRRTSRRDRSVAVSGSSCRPEFPRTALDRVEPFRAGRPRLPQQFHHRKASCPIRRTRGQGARRRRGRALSIRPPYERPFIDAGAGADSFSIFTWVLRAVPRTRSVCCVGSLRTTNSSSVRVSISTMGSSCRSWNS
jgi:hypothetical protein